MCVSVQNGVLMLMGIMKLLQSDYTIGLLNPKDTYSTDLIRTKFTRDIATTFKMACDELLIAVDDLIPATDGAQKNPTRRGYTVPHTVRRVGQGSLCRDLSTCDLLRHESCFCRSSSMSVIIFRFFYFFDRL
jgi:hypothetical protein